MSSTWTHKVIKMARGMKGQWFPFRAAGTFASEADARAYAESFAAEQTAAGVKGAKITVQTRGRQIVAAYRVGVGVQP